jgi:hypothetical protein
MPKHTDAFWHEVFEFALNSILNPDEHDVLVMHAPWVALEKQRCLTASPKPQREAKSPTAMRAACWHGDAGSRR